MLCLAREPECVSSSMVAVRHAVVRGRERNYVHVRTFETLSHRIVDTSIHMRDISLGLWYAQPTSSRRPED